MKKLMVLLLSFCLFHFQVGIAFADDVTATQQLDNQIKQDSDGKLTVIDEAKDKDAQSAAEKAMQLNSLSIFASGIMGPMYALWCSNMPSAWVYAATAGIYVTAEMISWRKYNKTTKDAMEAYNNQNVDEQVAALKAAAEQTKAAADTAKRKAMYAKLAATGYAAASVMSLIEVYTSWITANPGGKCVGAGALNSPKDNKMLEGFDFKVERSITHAIESTNSELHSTLLFDELLRVSNGKNHSITISEYEQKRKAFDDIKPTGLKSGVLMAIGQMKQMLFADAHAQYDQKLEKAGIFLGLASAAAVLIWPEVILGMTEGTWMRSVADSGITRAVVFGVHAGFATAGAVMIGDAQEKLNKRAAQFDLLAGQLKNMGSTNVVNNDATGGVGEIDPTTELIPITEDPAFSNTDTGGCFVDTANGQTATDETCSCKKTNSCKKAMVPSTKFQGFNPPAGYNQALGKIKATGNSLYAGDYTSASANANGAIGHGAMIGGMKKDLQNKLNDKMKEYKKKPINFGKLHKKFGDQFKSAVARSMNKMKPSDAKALMAMATGPSDSNVDQVKAQAATKDGKTEIETVAAKDPNAGSGAGKKDGAKDPFGGMNFNFEEQSKGSTEGKTAGDGKDYDYRKTEGEQISNKAETSIFSLITVRYIKTAFPILFSEEATKE